MPLYHVTIRDALDVSRTFPIDALSPNELGGMIAAYVAQEYGPGCTLRGVVGETSAAIEKAAAYEVSEKIPMHPEKPKPAKPAAIGATKVVAK